MTGEPRTAGPHPMELLERWSQEPEAASGFLERLGAEGTLRSLCRAGAAATRVGPDPVRVHRTCLETAAGVWTPDRCGAFGRALAEAATDARVLRREPRDVYDPAGALAVLVRGNRLPGALLGPLFDVLDAHERLAGVGTSAWTTLDPTAATLDASSRDPEVVLDRFADPARLRYYLVERRWSPAGFAGVLRAVLAATSVRTENGVRADAGAALAVEVIEQLASRDDLALLLEGSDRSNAPAGTALLASFLGRHLGRGLSARPSLAGALGRPEPGQPDGAAVTTLLTALVSSETGFVHARGAIAECRVHQLALLDAAVEADPAGAEAVGHVVAREGEALERLLCDALAAAPLPPAVREERTTASLALAHDLDALLPPAGLLPMLPDDIAPHLPPGAGADIARDALEQAQQHGGGSRGDLAEAAWAAVSELLAPLA